MDAYSCCSQFYEQEWVRHLLGDSFHPGGLRLSERLLNSLQLPPGSRVLDLACGTGSTALKMAQEYHWLATGMDLSQANLAIAQQRAHLCKGEIHFVRGQSDQLPFANSSFDAVVCECSLSIFQDKSAVIREIVRVLDTAGQLALSDMALTRPLPEPLSRVVAPWTCLSEAVSVEALQLLLVQHGFRIFDYHDESGALPEMLTEIKRKLLATGLSTLTQLKDGLHLSVRECRDLLRVAGEWVDRGWVEYFRLRGGLR